MADLGITYENLQDYVARFAGWAAKASWTSENTSDFALILARGLRLYYYPPALPDKPRHEWSFLRKIGTLSLSVADGHDYDMPSDFSGVIIGETMTYQKDSSQRRMGQLPYWQIASLLGKTSPSAAAPLYYALRPKTYVSGTGQRWEALMYPTPDQSYTAEFQYIVNPEVVTAGQYVRGGAAYSELLIQSVLAAAEEYLDDDSNGPHKQAFMAQLMGAVRLDEAYLRQTAGEDTQP